MSNQLKTMAEMVEMPRKKTVQPPEPPPSEGERQAAEILELETRFKSEQEALRQKNNAWHESRRPATQAVDDARRLAERVVNVRSYHQTARGHAHLFDERILLLVSAGGTPPGDLSIVANQAAGDPVGASAGRLSGYLQRSLSELEPEFRAIVAEARKLCESAPDPGPLLEDLESIIASLG